MSAKEVVRIDPKACTGCSRCVAVCPSNTLALARGRATVAGESCIGCCQCAAVCPESAVRVDGFDGWAESSSAFRMDDSSVEPGKYPVEELVRLMRSRRSVRSYSDAPVPMALLEDLVRIGVTAPSGTNSQKWAFTLLESREAVVDFATDVARFFKGLNRMAANPAIRLVTSLCGYKALAEYHREHYPSVVRALREWEEEGVDRLFHGAPAAMVVSSRPGASCPAEDALLATQNILLGAHALGLGTCLIGYAVSAMEHDGRIGRALGIPKGEKVYAVIAVGYPKIAYARTTRRKRPLVRVAGQ
ncbi:MAG: nitroreductase family protein [Desulfovibrio sp.]|nr:nitroreductase family protein [Desulfovibrio sp.]